MYVVFFSSAEGNWTQDICHPTFPGYLMPQTTRHKTGTPHRRGRRVFHNRFLRERLPPLGNCEVSRDNQCGREGSNVLAVCKGNSELNLRVFFWVCSNTVRYCGWLVSIHPPRLPWGEFVAHLDGPAHCDFPLRAIKPSLLLSTSFGTHETIQIFDNWVMYSKHRSGTKHSPASPVHIWPKCFGTCSVFSPKADPTPPP